MGYYGATGRNRQPGRSRYPVQEWDVGDYSGGLPAADVTGGGPVRGLRYGEADLDSFVPGEVLATRGYQHVSVEIPVALAPIDAPEGRLEQSSFNERQAQHRLSYTMRSYGHWEQENMYGKHVRPPTPSRRHSSKVHIGRNTPPFAIPVGNRRNSRRPAPQSYGDIVGSAPHGQNHGNPAVNRHQSVAAQRHERGRR
jgi:hypothetical protein